MNATQTQRPVEASQTNRHWSTATGPHIRLQRRRHPVHGRMSNRHQDPKPEPKAGGVGRGDPCLTRGGALPPTWGVSCHICIQC